MTESPETPEPGENPTDDELDVEAPNESAPGHEPDDSGDSADAGEPA
jgi:hypothetical protein